MKLFGSKMEFFHDKFIDKLDDRSRFLSKNGFKEFLKKGVEPFCYEKNFFKFRSECIHSILSGNPIPPIEVEIHPTNVCNLQCGWCIGKRNRKNTKTFLDTKILNRLIIDLVNFNEILDSKFQIKKIRFSGYSGEPLLHPEISKAIEKSIVSGFEVGLVTNGSLLYKEDIQNALANVKYIYISLDASTSKTHRQLKKSITGEFERILDSISQLVKNREKYNSELEMGLGFIMTSENYIELPKFLELANSLNINYIRIRPAIGQDRYSLSIQQLDEAYDIIEYLAKNRSNNDITMISVYGREEAKNQFQPNFSRCFSHLSIAVVGPTGDVFPCCHSTWQHKLSFGNLTQNTFEEIWKSNQRNNVLNNLDPRKDCKVCPPHAQRLNPFLYYLYQTYTG